MTEGGSPDEDPAVAEVFGGRGALRRDLRLGPDGVPGVVGDAATQAQTAQHERAEQRPAEDRERGGGSAGARSGRLVDEEPGSVSQFQQR
ncbi:hypothetical protein ACFZDP_47765 [Streptomyces mirabilis]|uniref:hypothetical protein n=1 Tax=Streptomyces mirabilis TaxID=68239 RepID=UPI0006BAA941|nr:hypothetical protein OK006_10582 [Actinobacteria bacterium OK006]